MEGDHQDGLIGEPRWWSAGTTDCADGIDSEIQDVQVETPGRTTLS